MIPHPCMTDFLQAYKANPEVKGYYNGDHIIYSGCDFIKDRNNELYLIKYSKIEDWGYNHLVSSFDQMTEWEKEILKDYFKRYE